MDTRELFALLLDTEFFVSHDIRRAREVSRWHMDDELRSHQWLCLFREWLLITLCSQAARSRERAVTLDVRAQTVMALIRRQYRCV